MSGASAPLVAAIEAAWLTIQTRHEDVPEVVVTLASGSGGKGMKLGHFAPERWQRGETAVHELFVGGEGLARGGAGVLGTLLHEAAHGAVTTVPARTAARYAAEVAALDAAIVAYRRAEPATTGGRKSNNNGVSAECSCGRKIRVSRSVLEAGPIVCGVCDEPFEAEDE